MRLLIVQDYLRMGGTERQSLFLAHAFRDAATEVELLAFRPGGRLAIAENLDGLRLHTLQGFDSRICLWAPGLFRKIEAIDPQVILCMGRTANCYAGFIQKRFPARAVVGTLRTGKMLFPLHHWSMGVVRAVIANSNWWRRRLLERNFPTERIHVVHNAVLLERSDEEHRNQRAEIRRQQKVSDTACIFLNVASFRPGKRHIDLLRAFAALREAVHDRDWRLWLVGEGAELKRCKRWAAHNGLGTRVRFFHFQQDPFPFYAGADVAVSTSREDSLPNFLVEAQATGLPVVAYDCRGVAETCRPGQTGIILPPGDREAFVQACSRLLKYPAARKAYAINAPAFARQRFSRAPQAQSTLSFLQSLV
jgi:glycosyltransferase involved in cell wall biosynthesis